jgi:hypothetical protein
VEGRQQNIQIAKQTPRHRLSLDGAWRSEAPFPFCPLKLTYRTAQTYNPKLTMRLIDHESL